jgi:hypothetical protein
MQGTFLVEAKKEDLMKLKTSLKYDTTLPTSLA